MFCSFCESFLPLHSILSSDKFWRMYTDHVQLHFPRTFTCTPSDVAARSDSGPVSQHIHVWHDKDPAMLLDRRCLSYTVARNGLWGRIKMRKGARGGPGEGTKPPVAQGFKIWKQIVTKVYQ